MTDKQHREYCQRQHRIVRNWLASQAWLRGIDCIVITSENIKGLFKLKKLEYSRIADFIKDVKPWFRYSKKIWTGRSPSGIFQFVFLSRVEISISGNELTFPSSQQRNLPPKEIKGKITELKDSLPRIELLEFLNTTLPTETEIVSEQCLLAVGLEYPRIINESNSLAKNA
jgi:hypothetical protein